jgi:CRISPR-associated protein Csb2
MAMAAAHFESGSDAGERAALEWLEAANPPAMRVSDAYERSLVRAYVPVNDVVSRPRQDRAFPRVRPHDDSVFLIWDSDPGSDTRMALAQVCGKVTRVGHSSSAVQMWVVPPGQEPEPNLLPKRGIKGQEMRVASAGTLKSLGESFNGEAIAEYDRLSEALNQSRGKEKARIKTELETKFSGRRPETRRPLLAMWQSYAAPESERPEEIADGLFHPEFIVLTKTEGPALGLEPTLRLTGALRNAAMKAAGANPPEWLTGHDADGRPTLNAHAAFFPLPYVGSEFADGHVMGLGMALPAHLQKDAAEPGDSELRRVLGPMFFDPATGEERIIRLWSKPRTWEWQLERETRERPPLALRRNTWVRPSRVWASVTPVVLHHYPKKHRDGDVERIIREAFISGGFPEPETVAIQSVSAVEGAGHAMTMPPYDEGGPGLCQYRTHALVRFRSMVRGPMLVGRGRFRGYGLFRPMPEKEQG